MSRKKMGSPPKGDQSLKDRCVSCYDEINKLPGVWPKMPLNTLVTGTLLAERKDDRALASWRSLQTQLLQEAYYETKRKPRMP